MHRYTVRIEMMLIRFLAIFALYFRILCLIRFYSFMVHRYYESLVETIKILYQSIFGASLKVFHDSAEAEKSL